jgi:hypothetical protein
VELPKDALVMLQCNVSLAETAKPGLERLTACCQVAGMFIMIDMLGYEKTPDLQECYDRFERFHNPKE